MTATEFGTMVASLVRQHDACASKARDGEETQPVSCRCFFCSTRTAAIGGGQLVREARGELSEHTGGISSHSIAR